MVDLAMDDLDRNIRRALGEPIEPSADDLIYEASSASGTPRQIALARVRATMAYLAEAEDNLLHPPAGEPLDNEWPLYVISETEQLWQECDAIYYGESSDPGRDPVVELLELVDDVARQHDQQERQLTQLQKEIQDGVLAPQLLKTLAESLGSLLREKINYHRDKFKQPTMTDQQLGEVVTLWRREQGDRNARGANKWRAAMRLARDVGFLEVHEEEPLNGCSSAAAIARKQRNNAQENTFSKRWGRRKFRRLPPDERVLPPIDKELGTRRLTQVP